jgi:hypothetical protein
MRDETPNTQNGIENTDTDSNGNPTALRDENSTYPMGTTLDEDGVHPPLQSIVTKFLRKTVGQK